MNKTLQRQVNRLNEMRVCITYISPVEKHVSANTVYSLCVCSTAAKQPFLHVPSPRPISTPRLHTPSYLYHLAAESVDVGEVAGGDVILFHHLLEFVQQSRRKLRLRLKEEEGR